MLLPHPRTRVINACAILVTGMIINFGVQADIPTRPSEQELLALDRLAKPVAGKVSTRQQETSAIIDKDTERSGKVDATMHRFLNQHQLGALLVQTTQPAASGQPNKPKAAIGPADPKKPAAKQPKVTTLKVECDGGLYFDSTNGVLAYLKNIRLTEDRFSLTCRDELKVFLEKKKEEPANKTDATKDAADKDAVAKTTETAKKEPKKEGKDDGLSSFGDPSRIIASGNVRVVTKDSKGKPFIASAATASYNAKSGQMILKGGTLRLQQSANQYLEARTANAYILIERNGSFVTSKTGWVFQTVTSKPTSKPKTSTP